MKKIFAISVLSVMAVVATMDAWAMESPPNYNLATVNYVRDIKLNLENDIYSRVRTSYVAESDETVTDANKDRYIPTVARVEAAIADAKPDTSGLVQKAQVIKADGTTTLGGTTVDAATLNKDTVAPTIANVEANFAPRIGDAVYSGTPGGTASAVGEIAATNLPRGEYSVIVSVDDSGNVSFRWVPIQIKDCFSTDGYTCGPA